MSRHVWIVLALLAAMLAARGFRDAGRAEALLDIERHRADSTHTYAMQSQHALVEELKTRDAEIVRSLQQRDSAVARADRLAKSKPAIITRIVEVAGDSAKVVEAVAELETAHTEETDALREALAAADSVNTSQRIELAEYAYVNGQLRNALEASRTESRAWEQTSKPKLFGLVPMTPTDAYFAGAATVVAGVVYMVLK